jgi:hypothetical protein
MRATALAVIVTGTLAAQPAGALTEAEKCESALSKAVSIYTGARSKALAACGQGVIAGKLASCPDAKTTDKVAVAALKLAAGVDKNCGSLAPASVGFGAVCPGIGLGVGADCDGVIADADDVAACLDCLVSAAADAHDALVHGALVASTDKAVDTCQKALSKAAQKLLATEAKELAKCADGVVKGKILGPCPDAGTSAKLSSARGKYVADACKSCGGANKACGGGDDLTPPAIGFATDCTDVTPPGGSACGGPIASLHDLVVCVECVADHAAACTAAGATPALGAYPAECAAGSPPPVVGALILNEFNAVGDASLLDGGDTVDPFFGAVLGNGGNWVELVVTQDHLDIRGWTLEWENADPDAGSVTFADAAIWSDLRSGTIITIREDDLMPPGYGALATDLSYDPAGGDWWIHANVDDLSVVEQAGFKVDNDDFRMRILDDGDFLIQDWVGEAETLWAGSGINSEEVGKLEQDPSAAAATTPPVPNYQDGSSSTFGAPNQWDGGASMQDFTLLRSVVP